MSHESSGDRPSVSCIRVKDWLLKFIREHDLSPGDRVPSERILASALGLSRPTVAKAIADLMAEGILTCEQRSGTFISSLAGRPSATDRAHVVGVVMPWLDIAPYGEQEDRNGPHAVGTRHSFSGRILQGILSVAQQHGWRLAVHSDDSSLGETEIIRHIPKEGVHGLIALPAPAPPNPDAYAELMAFARNLPVVFTDNTLPGITADSVISDNYGGARECVRYLISKGHRRIAYFTDFWPIGSIVDREAGYRAAIEEAGIEYDEEIVRSYELTRGRIWSFELALSHCLSLADPITAVFCLHDDVVLSTLRAARKQGIAVPGDLEVAGFFDDAIPEGVETPFTRVVQESFLMGQTAATFLQERLVGEAPAEPRSVVLPPRLIPSTV